MPIVSTKFAKMLVWKMNMTSNCDVTKSAHQMQMLMATICHWITPPWKFYAYATAVSCAKLVLKLSWQKQMTLNWATA